MNICINLLFNFKVVKAYKKFDLNNEFAKFGIQFQAYYNVTDISHAVECY